MLTAVRLLVVVLVLAGVHSAHADARRLWVYNVHTGDELRVAPFRNGVLRGSSWRRINRLFRSWRTLLRRPVHPRLVATLAHIQRHFGGRRLELVSGYRVPEDVHELTSYHHVGRAADIRIVGVTERALFEYCRTLPNVGCGYYPNGHHVHVDVRDRAGLWVDLSAPGDGRARHVSTTRE